MDPSGIYDSQVQNETSSDEFVLHARLPSLQEIAYNQIAIAVWYGYRSTPSQRHYENISRHKSIIKLELMDCHKRIKTLPIPRFMKEILNKYLKRVREETISCYRYFRYKLLSTNLYKYGIPQVDWDQFVWCPDGIINYKSTAIKMLHSGVLTEVQKFVIMSNFCIENEIKIFNLNRRPMKTFITKVNENDDYVLFYWICYLKNELHGIQPFFTRSLIDQSVTINSIYKNNCGAFEYFWNRLNAEDQISFISHRLRASAFDCPHWRRSLFYKMSHDQLAKLVSSQPVDVISLFINKIEMPEWAIAAWKLCKDRTSNEQFVDLLERLLDKFGEKNHILHRERRMSVLLEIWNTANDHHKNYAARYVGLEDAAVHPILFATNSLDIFFTFDDVSLWKKVAPSGFKFLLKLLSLKSADFRKNLILNYPSLSFIYNFDFDVVHEILELCLPNFHTEVDFKNYWSEQCEHIGVTDPYFCEIVYSEEDHDELNRRLLRCFQNLNISSSEVKKFIESLITANKRKNQTYYPLNSNDNVSLITLSKFTQKILQDNASTVLSMKESFVSSFSYNSDPFERYGSLYELSKLIEQEFVHEHLQELKHRLAEKLRAASVEQWVSYVLNYEKFNCVFSWCFENEEEMFLQVKSCIPINNIVIGVIHGITRKSRSVDCMTPFDSLQRFLEWYFYGVAENVISFKLSLLNDPEVSKILENMPERYEWHHGHMLERSEWLHGMCLQWIGEPNDLHSERITYGVISTMRSRFRKLYQFVRR